MSRLIETIRVCDGKPNNIGGHQLRVDLAFKTLWNRSPGLNLTSLLGNMSFHAHGLFKCRVIYDDSAHEIEVVPYIPKPIVSLKLVTDDDIQYDHKFEDRERLEWNFMKRGNCDDVLIARKGQITDASYANVALRRGDQWITPASGLLRGTQRQYLIDQKILREEPVGVMELRNFTSLKLINSMLLFDGPEIPTDHIER